jgi:hydrogenase nickel incorporation protein HypA/HybF
MHELSIAESMVEQLTEIINREGATKIESITLELGSFCGVEKEPFEFAFPVASKGTPAEGAVLNFVEVPFVVYCNTCCKESSPEHLAMGCAHCFSNDVKVISGKDFKIMKMEIC